MRERLEDRPIQALAEQLEQDLSAIRRAIRKPLESEVAKGNLTVPQTATMRLILRQPGITVRHLSMELSLAHSTVSGIVDRLERRGLIRRASDTADGRISRIFPTQPVTDFVREDIPRLTRGPLESALQRVGPQERATLLDALHRLRELLESQDGSDCRAHDAD